MAIAGGEILSIGVGASFIGIGSTLAATVAIAVPVIIAVAVVAVVILITFWKGCFRKEEGARDYLKIMSYAITAKNHGINAYDAIREAISGNPEFIFG